MWTKTDLTRADLNERRRLFKNGEKQILLLTAGEGVFAIANRCPHEGYPLSEGTLGDGCVLTCNWHNWKFDLTTGTALVGADPVRTYPVREENGELLIDLTDPPAEAQRERALAGLTQAIEDNDTPRMAREVARLARAGFPAEDALRHAIELSHTRFEFGMDHAYGAMADWISLAEDSSKPARKLAAHLEPIAHIAWDIQGEGSFPYPNETEAWNEAAFLAALETENEPAAQRLIGGAIAAEIPYAALRPTLARAALAHYADFGHSAIYVFKAGQLIERLGTQAQAPVLRALVRSLAYATREERLPEFRGYAKALAEWNGHGDAPARADNFKLRPVNGALAAVLQSSGRPVSELYNALLEAACWSLLHFDTRVEAAADNAIADNVGWLDFTHALTFANATRHLCEETPALWPQALLQLALFVGRNRKYIDPNLDVTRWAVTDLFEFWIDEQATLYDHGLPEPIISCHRVKVLRALVDEAYPGAPWLGTALAAVNRYLNTPMKRRHSLRQAAQAIDFIAREG